jgi:hypothetical protein
MVADGQDGGPALTPHGEANVGLMPANDLVHDMNGLRARLPDLRTHDQAGGIILQRFLDGTTLYAPSVTDPADTLYEDGTRSEPEAERNLRAGYQHTQNARKIPDYKAIQAMRTARSKLSTREKSKLDTALERWIRQEQTPTERLRHGGDEQRTAMHRFMHTEVTRLGNLLNDYVSPHQQELEIRRLLDCGASIELSESKHHSQHKGGRLDDKFDALSLILSLCSSRIVYNDTSETEPLIDLFLERGADPNTHGKLLQAVLHGSQYGAMALLDYGSSLNQQQELTDARTITILHEEASALSCGDYLEIGKYNTITALCAAFLTIYSKYQWRSDIIIERFLDRGADVNAHGESGITALHVLCCFSSSVSLSLLTRLFNLLLAHGADVNAQDGSGRTPLHCACFAINRYMVRVLLQSGANRNLETTLGEKPIDIIRSLQRTEQFKKKPRSPMSNIASIITVFEQETFRTART